ncbi:MAG: 2-phospho-L-lactate guanylyltransferase [Nitriliruptoraceae bacterium]
MPDVSRVVIPLRSFDAGKSRLSPVLDVSARQALIEAMLTDVLHAVSGSGATDVVIAACGDHAVSLARTLGVRVISDETPGGGLNAALTRVLATGSYTGQSVMIVAADLPRITADDLAALTAGPASVVIAPTHDDGTAVLLQRPQAQITLAYGAKSARAHALNATAAGCDVTSVRRDGLLYDLDTPVDLATALRDVDEPSLVAAPLGRHTQTVLDTMPRAAMNAATLPPQT